MRAAPDIARALGRLSVARGGPRDLANLRDGVKAARALRESLRKEALAGEALEAIETLAAKYRRGVALCPTGWNFCWSMSRRIFRAMAASSGPGRMRRWMKCAPSR